ncbi:MAG: TauD/TfdA family dioxygenase [Ilumatobacteraceae bacterium]
MNPVIDTLVALPSVDASGWSVAAVDELGSDLGEDLVHAAAVGARTLPADVDDALLRFTVAPPRAGALLLRNVPIGELPPTPPTPDTPVAKDLATELALLTVARRLGQPVGYVPEHGGRIVQNIVPTQSDADQQTSTSSRSNLMFHTETAFHPHRPRYLLLLCLRGDPAAHTTLASVHDIMDHLPDDVVDVMFQPRFRTAVDASFLAGRTNELGPARPLVTGTRGEPTFIFDADLTVGIDAAADDVLAAVRTAIAEVETSVVLEPGDLLVVDNNVAVHGRSPFSARFDGTDRWLQRSFVVTDLAPSAADRIGRVITTEFGRP